MDSLDLLLVPLYIALAYFVANMVKSRHAADPVYIRYYMRGMHYKMIGTLGFALIYLLYYKGGDSINYFLAAKPLYSFAFSNPAEYFEFVSNPLSAYPNACWYQAYIAGVEFLMRSNTTLTVIRFVSVVNLFCFNSYISCCIIFAAFSYYFIFKTFRLFVSIYPVLEKEFAIAFLMIPSAIFWGSGVGKDTIMFSGIMYFFYCFYRLVIWKQSIISNLIKLVITAYLISIVRGFVIVTLAPCLILMAAIYYRNSIQSSALRFLALPFFVGGGLLVSYIFIQNIGNQMQSYSLDSMQKTAEGFKSWHTYLGDTQGGSAYSLGSDVDYSPAGILRKAPLAIAIALFGPFFWQIRNPVMLLSGLESLAFLYFFFKVFLNMRAYRALGIIFKDHIIMFCIPFVIIIALAVGMTSFNYGALVRYKIPLLPFFAALIAITRYRIAKGHAD
ncbi:MAG TPA: hypothetical protein VK174_03035 [Chitinophagales bacterium]|nr:hypothetical protein [Chitinophagales bacterium]